MSDIQPSVVSGVFNKPFPEQVTFFRGKLGKLVPTKHWDDIKKSAHDTAFMVAGAQKADLLADLASAVDRSIAEGKSINAFRKDFRAIVQRRGWHDWTGEGTKAGVNWRTRVIYQTNASTSYAAGRVAQLRQGGFKFWIYRHNDSVAHPRPRHLAWDGLTLPKDDPFWDTHSAPNGWGCRCYLLGARSDAGAKRLGGNPDKKLNPAWKKTDPETGAPVGIDKGWDYQPGDRVSDTVQAMAQKTIQWEYTLAKSYMQGVPVSVRDNLARAYRDLPSVADDVRRYATAVLAGKDAPKYRTMGLLTSDDAAQILKIDKTLNVAGFDYAVDATGIKKINKDHGDTGVIKTESPRGQRGVTAGDYARLPALLNGYDGAIIHEGTARHTSLPVVKIVKHFNNEEHVTVWEIRKGRKMLSLQSMWIIVHKKKR